MTTALSGQALVIRHSNLATWPSPRSRLKPRFDPEARGKSEDRGSGFDHAIIE